MADIDPGRSHGGPASLTDVNGTLFFTISDGSQTVQLWKSDGTTAGTVMVKNILIDGGSYSAQLENLTNVNGTLFFSTRIFPWTNRHSYQLWKSDGTTAGTVLVKDNIPAILFVNVNGTLFFRAEDETHGEELWKSDGTTAGTVLVKDIFPGSTSSGLQSLINVNGTLFFEAYDGIHYGFQLWKSDGTAAGTVLVKEIIVPASNYNNVLDLTNVNGTLFFTVDDGIHGRELWKSDGTPAGTVLIKDLNPGRNGSGLDNLVNVNGSLFFTATDWANGRDELWKSDGTAAGTVLVKEIFPGIDDSWPYSLTNVNGTLFFVTERGTHGYELWKSDGTAAGTLRVKVIGPNTWGGFPNPMPLWANPTDLTAVNENLFFLADGGLRRYKLWKSDGTEAGTNLVMNINPFSDTWSSWGLTNVNGTLFFVADNGTHGPELWRTVSDAQEPPDILATGADAGAGPHVRVFDAKTKAEKLSFFAYDPGFRGGVRVATGDVNGDFIPDIITAPGPGGGPHIRVFDGSTGEQLTGPIGNFFAYDPGFAGGVFVASGDVNGDGFADVITGADEGGGPHVRVFSGADGQPLAGLAGSFFAYDPAFLGGVRVTATDINRDGRADIITAAGPGGGPHVRIFDGATGLPLAGLAGSFFAYDPSFTGGVFVATGDIDGDGWADLITGAGRGGGPHVRVFSGAAVNSGAAVDSGAVETDLADFFAYDPSFTGGVRVEAADVNDDGRDDILTGPGLGGGPHVRVFDGLTMTELDSLFAFDPAFTGGIFPAGSRRR